MNSGNIFMNTALQYSHIVLNVTNIERSRAFYTKVLRDFKVVDQSESHVAFSNGLNSIWLAEKDIKGKYFEGVAADKAVGLRHFAWKVNTLDALEDWEKYLKSQGIELQNGGITDDDFSGQGLFFRDPDNIRLEIHLK